MHIATEEAIRKAVLPSGAAAPWRTPSPHRGIVIGRTDHHNASARRTLTYYLLCNAAITTQKTTTHLCFCDRRGELITAKDGEESDVPVTRPQWKPYTSTLCQLHLKHCDRTTMEIFAPS